MRKLTSAILAVGLAVSAPLAAAAQQLSLNEISGYLNQLRTAEGDFTQINDDGSISTGTIYIKRPGKVRFEYNAPDSGLVVAGANTVVIYDKKSNQPAETYPLARTPLSIILADNVNLGRAKMVTGHSYDGTATTVTAQDPANPQYGNIQMKFTGNPVQLRQWIINDGNGSATTVVLGDMQVGGNISNSLFDTAGARAGGRR
ncbi:outer membrane lipoprotein carrier protein LolA [Sulfitobacter sp. KE29]|uniref:Outer membrane lipoprotein carrier protein LolA n=1 Tax=Sulfitobacter faviae TaxID=1775881 RepID=A0AAX3LQI6_9RHOB|nr:MULTISPECIES: outer membrane lipoprotein carrier protein LolA [Sulfitobacter]KZY53528.1 cell envelope biogenesis protein LolA [Sulfitobacter sp. HI0054]MBO9438473.1 outer membrane lipoprotein carrier protein LolA [Sulfitobacter sp. R18_2]MDF3350194.1 outer membrane lipoprotein carrier protein LolA [Sulfitobacter sp. KE12]MDF3353866.1 outer membrane lipoprotein carrier protein LolA [Sulfitobacter sp. KE27]MDF3357514.1 outer membrane lipoprotein carrier protein LolA [Sulfitobacter sp. KE33]|tara:strand:+ start:342 stop:947 length:606 start_codon:yes stop_codon:yes gene_type:complete